MPFTAWELWCGFVAFCRHVSETQCLIFLLESKTLLGRQLIVCGRREKGQPLPWLVGTLPSPPNSEDHFISVSFSSSRSRRVAPVVLLGFKGWRYFHRQSNNHWNVSVFKTALPRTNSCHRQGLPFYILEEQRTFSASLVEVSFERILGTCSFLVKSLELHQL